MKLPGTSWSQAYTGAGSGAIDCDAANVDTISLILYGSDAAELTRGGPWNCDVGKGQISGIQPAAGCTVVLLAADPGDVANFRGMVNDVAIISGRETALGVVSMAPYALAAAAGPDQRVIVGTEITLDGSGSFCDPAAPLVYRWELIAAPPGSAARLTSAHAVAPKFTADLVGGYTCSLIVSDGYCSSIIDQVTVHADLLNSQPVAHAGMDRQVVLGQPAALDGSASSDPESNPLTFNWAIADRPNGSLAQLTGSTQISPTVMPDVIGNYTIRLTVNDGQYDSLPDDVVVTAVNTPPRATISTPQDSSVAYLADPVVLSGAATDDQDGALTAGSLTWSSNVDGTLGNGRTLALSDLTPGAHRLTLTTTDTHGATHQAAVDVMVYYQRVVDTGQTQSFTDTQGEDADFLINPFAYVDNGDGTVSDNNTGLMWEQTAGAAGGHSFAEAESHCQNLTLGGQADWRLPDRKELVSITDERGTQSCFNMTFFPHACGNYWSSTSFIVDGNHAYYYENPMGRFRYAHKSDALEVKCVRGGR